MDLTISNRIRHRSGSPVATIGIGIGIGVGVGVGVGLVTGALVAALVAAPVAGLAPGSSVAAHIERRVTAAAAEPGTFATAVDTNRCWPPPVDAPVRDPFRAPACPWCPGNRGVEYATRIGQPVAAVAAGRVVFAGAVAGIGYITVGHADGRRISYGGVAGLRVATGDPVTVGQLLGSTATEAFHLGVRRPEPPPGSTGDPSVDTAGGYLDPTPWLGRWRTRARLVPVAPGVRRPPAPAILVCPNPDRPG